MKYLQIFILTAVFAACCIFWGIYPPKDFIYYLPNFALAAILFAVYLAFGIKMQKILKISAPAVKYPVAFALSIGAVGTLFFLAGTVGLYNIFFALAVLAAMAVFSYKEIKKIIFDISAFLKGLQGAQTNLTSAAFYAVAGFVFIYLFFACLTPPIYYDTLVYHLAVPEQYIQAGGIINMKENIFSFYPQLMQMNCLFVLLISNELCVKLLYFFMAIMSIAALAGLADELKVNKKVSVLLLAICPIFMLNASRIGAELPLMFFTALLFYILVKGIDSGFNAGDGLLAGIIAGMIMSIKYTGIVVYAFGAAVFIYMLAKKRIGARNAIMYLLVPACIVLPYIIKNYFYTGDPFYPFFTGMFDMEAGLKADAVAYVSHVNGFGMPHTLLNLIISPFVVVYNSNMFGGDEVSPLFLIALIVLPLTDMKKTGLAALFMVFYYITWFFTGEVMRFLLPVVFIMAVVAGQAFANINSKLKYLVFGLLIAVEAVSSFYFCEYYLRPFQVFAIPRNEYIKRYISYYPAADFINKKTERGAGIFVLGEARTFYIERPVLAYTVFNHRSIFEGFEAMNDNEILDVFKKRNIKYILFNWDELKRLQTGGYEDVVGITNSPKFKDIMVKYFTKVYGDEACEVFSLKEGTN